jgi:hypothetical protein
MGRASESVIIEIGDDAYKQNSVYRPWEEFQVAEPGTQSNTPANPLENLQPRLLSRHRSTPVNAPV